LKFKFPPKSESDESCTLQSLQKVKSRDGYYLLTYFGNCEEILWKENKYLHMNPLIELNRSQCSIYSTLSKKIATLVGCNFDFSKVGSILVTSCRPDIGYASISFSMAVDCGFQKGVEIENFLRMNAQDYSLHPFIPQMGEMNVVWQSLFQVLVMYLSDLLMTRK